MAWSENKIAGNYNTPTRDFICDDVNDLDTLPKNCPQGSTAFVIETSQRYMLNGSKEWKKINSLGGSEPGVNPGDDFIYDGGGVEDETPSDDNIYEGGGV